MGKRQKKQNEKKDNKKKHIKIIHKFCLDRKNKKLTSEEKENKRDDELVEKLRNIRNRAGNNTGKGQGKNDESN